MQTLLLQVNSRSTNCSGTTLHTKFFSCYHAVYHKHWWLWKCIYL